MLIKNICFSGPIRGEVRRHRPRQQQAPLRQRPRRQGRRRRRRGHLLLRLLPLQPLQRQHQLPRLLRGALPQGTPMRQDAGEEDRGGAATAGAEQAALSGHGSSAGEDARQVLPQF